MPQAVYEPTLELNADAYTPEQLEAYYEPNINVYEIDKKGREVLSPSKNCAYDFLAEKQGPYILFADRGVGKTHLLNLLGEQIKKRGGIFIAINPEDPGSPLRALEVLEDKFPTAQKELLYKHILFNVIEQALAPVQYSLRTIKDGILESLNNINFTIRVKLSNVELEQSKEKIQNNKKQFLQKETGNAQARVEKLLLKFAQGKTKKISTKDQDLIFERKLPPARSVYIILDKLDQAENEAYDVKKGNLYQQRILKTLPDLVAAVKYLNTQARKNKLPLKIILSLRAITFLHTVKPHLSNQAQFENMFFHLDWEKEAIERLLAKRILFPNTIRDGQTWQDVLETRLPKRIHYMGREFSAIDFLTELSENRPRRAMAIWQKAVSETHVNMLTTPFDAKLSEEEFYKGYTAYVTGSLISEICREHELDYPGIEALFTYWVKRRDEVGRIIGRETIHNIVNEFLGCPAASELKEQDVSWVNKAAQEILQILYEIGAIGIVRTKPENIKVWPEPEQVHFVDSKNDIQVDDYFYLAVRPILWAPLTDLESDIIVKRKFLSALYQSLENHLPYVDSQIESLINPKMTKDSQAFEYAFARFFVICQMIREFVEYPEPTDWEKWHQVVESIEACWDAFAQSVLSATKADPMYNISIISEYAVHARPYIFQSDLQGLIDTFSVIEKDQFLRIEKSPKYEELFEKIRKYPLAKQFSTETSLRLFRQKLNVGKNSLNDALQID